MTLDDAAVKVRLVGWAVGATHGGGGVHVQVNPDAGIFVGLRLHTAEMDVPATDVAHVFVPFVTDLRLKSEVVVPTNTIPGDSVFVSKQLFGPITVEERKVPKTTWMVFEVSFRISCTL